MKAINVLNVVVACVLVTINVILFKEADMAAIYVALIVKGRRTFSSVPITVKEKVRQILIDLEMEELIDE